MRAQGAGAAAEDAGQSLRSIDAAIDGLPELGARVVACAAGRISFAFLSVDTAERERIDRAVAALVPHAKAA